MLTKLLSILGKPLRKKLWILTPFLVLMGILEAVGIAFVVPFLSLVLNPKVIHTSRSMSFLYTQLGFTNNHAFLIFFGSVALGLLIFGDVYSAAMYAWIYRFTNHVGYRLVSRLLQKYLYQPYAYYLDKNVSDLGKNVLNEVYQVQNYILISVLQIFNKAVGILFIIIVILFFNPYLALSVGIGFSLIFGLIFYMFKRMLKRTDKERFEDHATEFRTINEVFGGIKEVKLLGKESVFLGVFKKAAKRLSKNTAASQTIGYLPKYALEICAFGSVVGIVLFMLARHDSVAAIIPTLALFAFAGYRMMPALQMIFSSIVLMKTYASSVDILYKDLILSDELGLSLEDKKRLVFERDISLENIEYQYPAADKAQFNGLNFSIQKNTTIGLVGSTGAGKTTLVDIVLGLLVQNNGLLKVDGQVIDADNLRAWQNNIGYVPQHIYLYDNTIRANIAYGVLPEDIDDERVIAAAILASIHEFVTSELPDAYETVVGDKGIKLSGGQRQRIGIARALYRDPSLLVLDEATSALDSITENAIMEAIDKLSHNITIIMIAHRITTVKACDVIYVLEQGEVVSQGTYTELIEASDYFKRLAKINSGERDSSVVQQNSKN